MLAPLARYLNSDLTAKILLAEYNDRHPDFNCQKSKFRRVLKEMRISFKDHEAAKCDYCETHKMHAKETWCQDDPQCEICQENKTHKKEYTAARIHFHQDRDVTSKTSTVTCMDMQKVKLIKVLLMYICDSFLYAIF